MKKLINTTRGEFNVRTYGDSTKPPLIMVHGWPQSSYCWHHMTPFLNDHYVVAPDLRGMGDSNRKLDVEAYEKDEMARDMFAVADALEIPNFHLAGHDWGGAIVQEMAFIDPERIEKLIILNMVLINNIKGQYKAADVHVKHLFKSSWYQFFMSMPELPEALIVGKEEVWVRFFSRGISNPIPEDAIAEYTRCYKIPGTITTTSNMYRNVPNDRKRWKNYIGKVIDIPTKLIYGILDPVIIKEYLIGAEEVYANVEIEQLEGGHFILDEQPELVAKHINKFLAS